MINIDMPQYRLSSYTIPVKLDGVPDHVMLVHGCTGAIDIAHNNIAAFLQFPGQRAYAVMNEIGPRRENPTPLSQTTVIPTV